MCRAACRSSSPLLPRSPVGARGPLVGEGFQLLDDLVDGVLLLLRWVAVLGEETLDDRAEAGLDVVAGGPIDREVGANCNDQVSGDGGELLLADGHVSVAHEFLDR